MLPVSKICVIDKNDWEIVKEKGLGKGKGVLRRNIIENAEESLHADFGIWNFGFHEDFPKSSLLRNDVDPTIKCIKG